MSKFYGRIKGNRGEATRCGYDHIAASVQSYNGSITTELTYKDDKLMVNVSTSTGSSSYGSTIFYGTFDEYIARLKNN